MRRERDKGKYTMRQTQNGHPKRPVWFVEAKEFTAHWSRLRLDMDDLFALQDLIKADPTLYPVISGTGGLRKIRFAPQSSRKGKRGALRVCFAFLPRFAVVFLVMVFPKNEKADLAAPEKKTIKDWLKRIEQEFERKLSRDLEG
jgi:hypothetical protein